MAEEGGIWYLKLDVRMYRDEKLKAIRKETESSDFFQIWIAFLCLAICKKRDGSLYISERRPYTVPLLAEEIGFNEDRIEEAIQRFEEMDMVEVRNGAIWIRNWKKYQSVMSDTEYKEKARLRMQKSREKKKQEALAAEQVPVPHEPPAPAESTTSMFDGFEIPEDELTQIREDHNDLLNLAEEIKLAESDWDRNKVIELYSRYGREKLEYAMNEAAKYKKISFGYIEKVIKNYGTPKQTAEDEEESRPKGSRSADGWTPGKKLRIIDSDTGQPM